MEKNVCWLLGSGGPARARVELLKCLLPGSLLCTLYELVNHTGCGLIRSCVIGRPKKCELRYVKSVFVRSGKKYAIEDNNSQQQQYKIDEKKTATFNTIQTYSVPLTQTFLAAISIKARHTERSTHTKSHTQTRKTLHKKKTTIAHTRRSYAVYIHAECRVKFFWRLSTYKKPTKTQGIQFC